MAACLISVKIHFAVETSFFSSFVSTLIQTKNSADGCHMNQQTLWPKLFKPVVDFDANFTYSWFYRLCKYVQPFIRPENIFFFLYIFLKIFTRHVEFLAGRSGSQTYFTVTDFTFINHSGMFNDWSINYYFCQYIIERYVNVQFSIHLKTKYSKCIFSYFFSFL